MSHPNLATIKAMRRANAAYKRALRAERHDEEHNAMRRVARAMDDFDCIARNVDVDVDPRNSKHA